MKMATMEADVKKDSTNGVRHVESVKKEVVVTLNNHSEKEAVEKGKNVLTVTPKLSYVIHRARLEECLLFSFDTNYRKVAGSRSEKSH